MTCCPPQIVKKKKTCRLGSLESSHCGAGKTGSFFFHPKSHFQPIFYQKHLENTLETLLNQSMATKKPTNRLKTWNPPKTKIPSELRFVVLGAVEVKKNLNVTPSHHMKSVDTKINRFGDYNLPKRLLSLFRLESGDSLSLFPTEKDWKNRKIKLGTKIYCLKIQ